MTRVKWMVLLSLVGCGPVVDGAHQAQLVAVNSSTTGGGTTGGTSGGTTGGGGDGTTCKSITLHGKLFYNDQRKYGRFPLRYDEHGALGVQYAVHNGDNEFDHSPNYLGMLDATVQIYEVDKVTSAPDCVSTTFEGSTTVAADGSWTWSGEVCDPCYGDDLAFETSEANRTGVSLAVKFQTRYCPDADGRCISVRSPGSSLENAQPFDDHADGAWVYELWTSAASLTDPRRVFLDPADITLANGYFRTQSPDSPYDKYAQAANAFASLVDVTRKMHVTYGIPFNRDFGEVKSIYPMNWVSGGNGHSHQASAFCLPAQRAGDQTGTVGDIIPEIWPVDTTTFHEYGHLVMYRAWWGFGKWVRLDFDIDGDGNVDADEGDSWDTEEFFGNGTKEPWAEFIKRVTLNGVTDGGGGTNKETLHELGCDRSTGFDDDVTGATFPCSQPSACDEGHRNPDAVVHALCDWYDDRVDGADADGDAFTSAGDEMSGEQMLSIYNAMRDAWLQADPNVQINYMLATSWASGVTRGVHLCDFAAAYVLTTPADRWELDETLKHNGIDCQL